MWVPQGPSNPYIPWLPLVPWEPGYRTVGWTALLREGLAKVMSVMAYGFRVWGYGLYGS